MPISGNPDDAIAATVLFVLSSIALTCYVLVCISVYKIWADSKNAFYLLILFLGISDSLMLALFSFYSTPATIIQDTLLGRQFEVLFCGTLCNVTYFTSLSLLINIALNRYWTICRQSTQIAVYDQTKILCIIGGCWLYGLVSALAQMTPCCSLRYYESDYTWGYDMTLAGNESFVWYDRSANLVTFLCLISFYSLIFWKLRSLRTSVHPALQQKQSQADVRRQRAEFNLAIQSGLVAGLMITFGLAFTIIPLVTTNKWCLLISSVLYIAAIGVHPFVYLAFNEKIRHKTIGFFRHNNASVTAVSTQGKETHSAKAPSSSKMISEVKAGDVISI